MIKQNKNTIVKFLAQRRFPIQIVLGVGIYLGMSYFQISLWWLLGVGTLLGIFWGKVFCRWMCPVGIMMEMMMKAGGNSSLRNMYQYHKIGCPIAWISGLLNKISIFQITKNEDTCKNCGLCDKACYMPAIDKEQFSLYKPQMSNPAQNFSCSKCLMCVESCPNGSLSFKPAIINNFKNKK